MPTFNEDQDLLVFLDKACPEFKVHKLRKITFSHAQNIYENGQLDTRNERKGVQAIIAEADICYISRLYLYLIWHSILPTKN